MLPNQATVQADAISRLLRAQASHVASGAKRLRAALEGGPDLGKAVADVLAFDDAAGKVAESIIASVYAAPSLPFDRGSAKDLATALDDASDEIRRVAGIAAGGHSLSGAFALADLVVASADAVAVAMPWLDAAASHVPGIVETCTRVERAADDARSLQQAADLEIMASHAEGTTPRTGHQESRHAREQAVHGLVRLLERLGDVTAILRDIAYESL